MKIKIKHKNKNKNKQRKNKMLFIQEQRTLGLIKGLKHFSTINNKSMSTR